MVEGLFFSDLKGCSCFLVIVKCVPVLDMHTLDT
jgi:hypothetical protein